MGIGNPRLQVPHPADEGPHEGIPGPWNSDLSNSKAGREVNGRPILATRVHQGPSPLLLCSWVRGRWEGRVRTSGTRQGCEELQRRLFSPSLLGELRSGDDHLRTASPTAGGGCLLWDAPTQPKPPILDGLGLGREEIRGKTVCWLLAAYISWSIWGMAQWEDTGSTALMDTPIQGQVWPQCPFLSLSSQGPGGAGGC